MAPTRGSRKTVVISSDEEYGSQPDLENIQTDDEGGVTNGKAKPQSPFKALKHQSKNPATKKRTSAKSSPQKVSKVKAVSSKSLAGKSNGSLFSFFNAATQRQRSSSRQGTPPAPKKSIQAEEVEAADNIEDGEGNVRIANGSRTALAARKRKQDDTSHIFEVGAYASATASQKFRKTTAGTKVLSAPKSVDHRPWMERFAPADLDELAVHSKKVKDVRSLLEEAFSPRGRPRLILLKGPAGTGKTTTVQLLAKSMALSIKEWHNPTNVEFGSDSFVSTSRQFEEFVLRSSKFTGLDLFSNPCSSANIPKGIADSLDSQKYLLLVEEFPVTVSRSSPTLQSFRSTLKAYLSLSSTTSQPAAPIVLVLTETLMSSSSSSESLTPHRLLGPALLSHPLTAVIEFNPIAPTLLTKALSIIATKEARVSGRRRTPGPAVLVSLAEMGDIRSAASALEFLCLRGDEEGAWGAKVSFGKHKGTKSVSTEVMTQQETEALKVVGGREGVLGLWHGVGKVVYNKRLELPRTSPNGEKPAQCSVLSLQCVESGLGHAAPPDHLSHLARPKIPENDPDTLLLELSTDVSTFVAAIHENIIPSCHTTSSESTLQSIDECFSTLSDSDALGVDRFAPESGRGTRAEGLKQEEMVFHAAVRGCVFWLPYPVKRETSQAEKRRGNVMAWPRSLRVWREKEEISDLTELISEEYSATVRNYNDGEGGLPSARSKDEMVQEMLPYLRVVHQAKMQIGPMRDRVRRVARLETLGLQGAPMLSGEGEEEDDEDGGLEKRRERRTRTGRGEGGFLDLGIEDDVKGLILSDDDIVDD